MFDVVVQFIGNVMIWGTISILLTIHLKGLLMVIWAFLDDQPLYYKVRVQNSWYDKVLFPLAKVLASDEEYHYLGYRERLRRNNTPQNEHRSSDIIATSIAFLIGGVGGGAILSSEYGPIVVFWVSIASSLFIARAMVRSKKKLSVLIKHAHTHNDSVQHESIDVTSAAKEIHTPFYGEGDK